MARWLPDSFDPDQHNARVQAWRDKEAAESAIQRAKADSGVSPRQPPGPRALSLERSHAASSAPISPVAVLERAIGHANPFVVVPWPPSGNTAVRHTKSGGHYLAEKVVAYRAAVLEKCVGRGGVHGQFRLNVHFSPPDARPRDMDNAMKSLFDALVPAGFIPADSMTFMRELWVTVDDKRLGTVAVEAIPLGKEAA